MSFLKPMIVAAGLFAGVAASANIDLPPGGSATINGTTVTCQGNAYPQPPPPPTTAPPPPMIHERQSFFVRADTYCLGAIPHTDGKATMKAAQHCETNNPEYQSAAQFGLSYCTSHVVNTNFQLANQIISGCTTVIYDNQKAAVQEAASDISYDCDKLVPAY